VLNKISAQKNLQPSIRKFQDNRAIAARPDGSTTMLSLLNMALAFSSPQSLLSATSRREVLGRALGGAAAAGLAATPAWAVAPPSPQQMLKSRAVYGSRVFRLQEAPPATIMDEKNVFTLFITGVYGASADKPTRVQLEKLEKAALAAAKKGDAAGAQAAIKEFVSLGRIEELDVKPGSYYNAKSPCDRAGLQCGYQYKGYLGSRMED
jgi:hypothetical protein